MMTNELHITARSESLAAEYAPRKEAGVKMHAAGGQTPPVPLIGGRRSPAGFTLLEVMIAVAIIGGLLVSLIYSLNYHLGIAERHEFVTVASLLAKDKLAEAEKNPVPQKGDFPDPFSGYHYESSVAESPFPGIAEITVTVSRGKESVKFSDLVEAGK
jgi:general secretion pathway protein I